VVANAGGQGTALVPLGAGVPPDPFNRESALARITNSI